MKIPFVDLRAMHDEIRTEVEAVPIDVVVVDNQGKPVGNLEASNFTVTVDAASGATDNGTGTLMALEAARILTAIGAKRARRSTQMSSLSLRT